MKKVVMVLMTAILLLSVIACGNKHEGMQDVLSRGSVELNVRTIWGGNDGNKQKYEEAIKTWQMATGNVVNDSSGFVDETFKARVITDFEVGAEPDVLFYFNGSDADPFVLEERVVSIEEIKKEFPDYVSNMNEELIPASTANGKKYAVPSYGYWEAMYVNKEVLEKSGVEIPGKDYTWEEFLVDCEKIKAAGYAPIAVSLASVPHYLFEFAVYNHLSPETHSKLPKSIEDENGQAWIAGIEDIKEMYEQGFFPDNTLSASDDETFQMFIEGEAAFLIDGSWKAGSIERATTQIDNFTVTYFPGRGERKTTDMIVGLSSGWYITRKAWEDPEKKATAVQFVQFMTNDTVVSNMADIAATTLKKGATVDESKLSSLKKDCLKMMAGMTGMSTAVQDFVPQACRVSVFDGMPNIVTGKVKIEDAVQRLLDLVALEEKRKKR